MKYSELTPNVTHHKFVFEPEDKDIYHRCLWARIELDHDNFTLSTISDCGNYSYSWGHNSHETFLDLMCRINGSYLLDKIASRSRFNLKESVKGVINNLKYIDKDSLSKHTSIKEMKEDLLQIDTFDPTYFFLEADRITCGKLSESIDVVADYPPGAIAFCDLFVKYLQPILREKKATLTT